MHIPVLQLMSELDNGDILLDKCAGRLIPKPINGVSSRALLEEYSRLSEPTARPTINCFVSIINPLSVIPMEDFFFSEADAHRVHLPVFVMLFRISF